MAQYVLHDMPEPFIINEVGTDEFVFQTLILNETQVSSINLPNTSRGFFMYPAITWMAFCLGAMTMLGIMS